jgi:opacity protein-like surface antigen
MTWHARVLGAVAVLGLAFAQPVDAQERGVGIAVRGGGFNGLASLNESGRDDFKQVGYSVGGAVTVDVHEYVALRGDFTFARNELQHDEVETGLELNRYFYDAAVQVQYPSASGWTPYAFMGAGGVTLEPSESEDESKTKLAGTAGLGLNYTIPGSGLGLFVEGKSWLYEFSELNGGLASFDRNQLDVTWSAGLSYRIPFASSAR